MLGFATMRHRNVLLLLWAALLSCRQSERPPQASLLTDTVAKGDSCRSPVPIGHLPPGTTDTRACALIRAALTFLARPEATVAGVSAVDASSAQEVGIFEWKFRNSGGSLLRPYWTIEFRLRDRPYDIGVYLRENGQMEARRLHKK